MIGIAITAPGRANQLVTELADTGLVTIALDEDHAHIVDLHDTAPDDVLDELAAYADRLGIHNAETAETPHTKFTMQILNDIDCIEEVCNHEDGCPTEPLNVCLACNAIAQGTGDFTEWQGAVVLICPECRDGKHQNCLHQALRADDEIVNHCDCASCLTTETSTDAP